MNCSIRTSSQPFVENIPIKKRSRADEILLGSQANKRPLTTSYSQPTPMARKPTFGIGTGESLIRMGNGGMLVNTHTLLANSSKFKGSQNLPKPNVQAKKLVEAKLNVAIDNLLNRKSLYDEQEKNEWYGGLDKKMDNWKKHEYIVQKENEKTIAGIVLHNCNFCVDCKLLTEQSVELCRTRGHSFVNTAAVKKYFECMHCNKRTYTLTRLVNDELIRTLAQDSKNNVISAKNASLLPFIPSPNVSCEFCQKADWVACGVRGSHATGNVRASDLAARGLDKDVRPTEEKLIVSACEWTSEGDHNRIAVFSSTL